MEKLFKFVDEGSLIAPNLWAVNNGIGFFLGKIKNYSTIPEQSRQVGIGNGELVTEIIRPALVRFELTNHITVECPIEAVER